MSRIEWGWSEMNEIERKDEKEQVSVTALRSKALLDDELQEEPGEEAELVWEIPRRWCIY
jgi:hypothetical protein